MNSKALTRTLYLFMVGLILFSISALFYKAVLQQDFDIIAVNDESNPTE